MGKENLGLRARPMVGRSKRSRAGLWRGCCGRGRDSVKAIVLPESRELQLGEEEPNHNVAFGGGLQGLSTVAARRCIGPDGSSRAQRVQDWQQTTLAVDMCEEGWGTPLCNGTPVERSVDVSGAWLPTELQLRHQQRTSSRGTCSCAISVLQCGRLAGEVEESLGTRRAGEPYPKGSG